MKLVCRTLFDCTHTGTTGHFKMGQVPYRDRAGNLINDVNDWTRSRNQQRNFETIMQMVSLRAQPTVVRWPYRSDNEWTFEFEVETPGVYSSDGSATGVDTLLAECEGAPMIVGLDESMSQEPRLITQGAGQNIWFETVNIPL